QPGTSPAKGENNVQLLVAAFAPAKDNEVNQAFLASARFWTLAPNSTTGALHEPYQAQIRRADSSSMSCLRNDIVFERWHSSAVCRREGGSDNAAAQGQRQSCEDDAPHPVEEMLSALQTGPSGQTHGLRLRT